MLYSPATLDKVLREAVKSGVACIGCKCGQCLRNSFFFPLIAESQLRKVRESKQPAYKIFGKQTFAQFFFLHKILVMRHQLLSGYFGLYPHSLSDKSGGEKSLFLLKMATLVTSVN